MGFLQYKQRTIFLTVYRPAGFRGRDVVTVTKQVSNVFVISLAPVLTQPLSIGKIVTRAFGVLKPVSTSGMLIGVIDPFSAESNALEFIHDAFEAISSWKNFMPSPQYTGVWLDTHIYQVFSDAVSSLDRWSFKGVHRWPFQENGRTESEHIKVACQKASDLRSSTLPIVVGEWSPAATDCAKWLNGRGVGSRFDHSYGGGKPDGSCVGKSGDASTFSDSYKKFLGQYWEAQTSTYEKAGKGWVQWTWKAEAADEWSYEAGLKNGWIPGDANSREYTNICDGVY